MDPRGELNTNELESENGGWTEHSLLIRAVNEHDSAPSTRVLTCDLKSSFAAQRRGAIRSRSLAPTHALEAHHAPGGYGPAQRGEKAERSALFLEGVWAVKAA